MHDFRKIGSRLSNWNRWGPDDQRGTLNFITAERIRAAAAEVTSGEVFELSLPLGPGSPAWRTSLTRVRPMHVMTSLPGQWGPELEGTFASDDWLMMPLQGASQWDGLGHFGYDDYFYNGVHMSQVDAGGAARNGIERSMPGVVSRGVLLDIAGLRGVDWLQAGQGIMPADLEAAEERQGVRVQSGDALLVRTGWGLKAAAEGWEGWTSAEPGLTLESAEWLHQREVAAVASDNSSVEVQPNQLGSHIYPVHAVLIRDMGMTLGEIFNLEDLAASCARDGRWSFLISAPPLRIPKAVGSPATPIVIK
jgi:kynurenine formamidase